MTRLAQKIRETTVRPGSLALFWIAQAGFVFKSPGGKILYIDPYLSNSVARLLPNEGYGFKRIMGTPIEIDEVEADCVACTHFHEDHYDRDTIPVLGRDPRIHFIGAPDCRPLLEARCASGRFHHLACRGDGYLRGYSNKGCLCRPRHLRPDALGYLITVGDIRVWQTGDTAYRPDRWQDLFKAGIDILLPPINGAYGNLNGVEAARLAGEAGVKVAIPCHFWLFAEHHGDPAEFMEACKQYAPKTLPHLMTQGELFVYER